MRSPEPNLALMGPQANKLVRPLEKLKKHFDNIITEVFPHFFRIKHMYNIGNECMFTFLLHSAQVKIEFVCFPHNFEAPRDLRP